MQKSPEFYRKLCLKGQTELRQIMTASGQHGRAIQLFLSKHAMLHSPRISRNLATHLV